MMIGDLKTAGRYEIHMIAMRSNAQYGAIRGYPVRPHDLSDVLRITRPCCVPE
jgi:hypothetical protein